MSRRQRRRAASKQVRARPVGLPGGMLAVSRMDGEGEQTLSHTAVPRTRGERGLVGPGVAAVRRTPAGLGLGRYTQLLGVVVLPLAAALPTLPAGPATMAAGCCSARQRQGLSGHRPRRYRRVKPGYSRAFGCGGVACVFGPKPSPTRMPAGPRAQAANAPWCFALFSVPGPYIDQS